LKAKLPSIRGHPSATPTRRFIYLVVLFVQGGLLETLADQLRKAISTDRPLRPVVGVSRPSSKREIAGAFRDRDNQIPFDIGDP
jgi:hypothetical protein